MEQRASYEVSGDPIPEPEPAHLHRDTETDSDEELEATELRESRPTPEGGLRLSRILTPGEPIDTWYGPPKKFWRHHIRLSVPHVDCRDHLANERTFLGYLRTSIALSMLGAVIAQLWRIQHSPTASPVFGYYVVSKPLAAILQIAALGFATLGTIRFFRQQSAMSRGKVHAGGWELHIIMVFMSLLMFVLFALHVGIDIYKKDVTHQDR